MKPRLELFLLALLFVGGNVLEILSVSSVFLRAGHDAGVIRLAARAGVREFVQPSRWPLSSLAKVPPLVRQRRLLHVNAPARAFKLLLGLF